MCRQPKLQPNEREREGQNGEKLNAEFVLVLLDFIMVLSRTVQ